MSAFCTGCGGTDDQDKSCRAWGTAVAGARVVPVPAECRRIGADLFGKWGCVVMRFHNQEESNVLPAMRSE
jgi:hypothetical protein